MRGTGRRRLHWRSVPARPILFCGCLFRLRWWRPILSAGSTGTTRSAGSAWTTGPLWAVLVRCQFAVAVLVQFLQRLAGLGDFVGVDGAVLVEVECFNDGHHR